MITELFKSSQPLPKIPVDFNKKDVKTLLKKYALANNFLLTVARSNNTMIHFQCKKGGKYRNSRNLTEDDRKCWRNTQRSDCPFFVRIGTNKSGHYIYLPSTKDEEHSHNHRLEVENVLSNSMGRKKMLDSKDIETLQQGIEQNIPTRTIQKVLSEETQYNKLTVHDINDLKYSMTNRVDIRSDDGAANLIDHMESKGYIVECKRSPVSGNVDGIFFLPILLF